MAVWATVRVEAVTTPRRLILRPCEAMGLVADDCSSGEFLWSAETADSACPDWLAFRNQVMTGHGADG